MVEFTYVIGANILLNIRANNDEILSVKQDDTEIEIEDIYIKENSGKITSLESLLLVELNEQLSLNHV